VASAWADLLALRPPPAFWSWVAEFQPQVIYSLLGTTRIMGLVLRVSRACHTPIVPHFMDDWPRTYYRGRLKSVPRWVMLARLRAVMRKSSFGMSICSAMAAEYERRYGNRFLPFMNCVTVPSECPAASRGAVSGPLKFVYVGGLHLKRWQALQAVGRALLALREEGCQAELVVHAPAGSMADFARELRAYPAVRLGPSLAQDQIPQTMRDADVLVHVESFEREVLEYTRLSLSTKVPQYMASGRAILAYGPRELASCRYIQDSQSGVVVGEQDPAALLKAVRLLAIDAERRALFGRRAWGVARQCHDGASVRESFRSVLAKATSAVRIAAGAMPGVVAPA
jgi:glycosyltransferase involved in cell wall biosynthesis